EFLNEHPELKRLAEQLGRSREAKSTTLSAVVDLETHPRLMPPGIRNLNDNRDIAGGRYRCKTGAEQENP
ncbi:hypothetical protein O5833_29630, partial [Escherichia coli]|nr:hypothetical protein [Escherichia coli]